MKRTPLLVTLVASGVLVAVAAAQPPVPLIDLPDDERQKIEQALPAKAVVPPAKPRKLLIFDLNVGYPGHRSIPHANLAFTLMGKKTGAFEAVVRRDPAVFRPESLDAFDAVFFNNTVGNLFEEPALRQSLLEFVRGGRGLLGVHGTSVAFTRWPGAIEDWPEFGRMLGARGAAHRESDERVHIKLDDPQHPLNRPFKGKGFEYRDEFFRFHEPYSRDLVRVLLSIDVQKTDLNQGLWRGKVERPDNDYALAWVRSYGKGRVFYCAIAHNPRVFWDPLMLQFYLGAIQFALGDLPAPTEPSGPAAQRQRPPAACSTTTSSGYLFRGHNTSIDKMGSFLVVTVHGQETGSFFGPFRAEKCACPQPVNGYVLGRPPRGASFSMAAIGCAANRLRHNETVFDAVFNRGAIF